MASDDGERLVGEMTTKKPIKPVLRARREQKPSLLRLAGRGVGCAAMLVGIPVLLLIVVVGVFHDPVKEKKAQAEATAKYLAAENAKMETPEYKLWSENHARALKGLPPLPVPPPTPEQAAERGKQAAQRRQKARETCEKERASFLEASIRMNQASQRGDEAQFDKWHTEMNKRADRQLKVCKCVDYPDAEGCK